MQSIFHFNLGLVSGERSQPHANLTQKKAVNPKYMITVMQRVAYIDDEVRQGKVTQQHYLYRGIRLRALTAYLCLIPSGRSTHGNTPDTLSAFGANAVRSKQ